MTQIKSSTQDVNQALLPGDDDFLGHGRIHALNALTLGAPAPDETKALVTINYTYDGNGNQIQKGIQIAKAPSSIFTYTYDFEGRLTQISYPDNTGSEYTYDGLGKRIQSTEKGKKTKETHFLYDGLSAILERNQTGVTQAAYTRGLSYGGGIGGVISGLLRKEEDEEALAPFFYHYDGIGTVTDLTDEEGELKRSYTYDAFGNLLAVKDEEEPVNPYRFSTKEYSPSSGLIYFGARYYDPGIGRWLTRDPDTGSTIRPFSLTTGYDGGKIILDFKRATDRGAPYPVLLGHELAHAERDLEGRLHGRPTAEVEREAQDVENQIAEELGKTWRR